MKLSYKTDRLILRILEEEDAPAALSFYRENMSFFAPYDPIYPDSFLTIEYQTFFISACLKQFANLTGLRYYLFLKEQPERIIGCVGFYDLRLGNELSCSLSYKLSQSMQHHGYASEAVAFLLQSLSMDLGIHRVEADILPDNPASIRLVTRLGFHYEGIAKRSHRVSGVWKDHARYALLLD